MTSYLAWLSFNGKLYPQKWLTEQTNAATGKPKECLKKFKLAPDEERMTLDELANKYPMENENAKSEDVTNGSN